MERKPLDASAFSLMVLLTALWGFQQVAIKVTAADVSLVMQAGIRSLIATALLLVWIFWKKVPMTRRDGTLWPGIAAGLLFGGEFVFIYAGLEHTAASRMVVFIYLAPIVTALGVHWWVPGEHLVRAQWLGVALSFGGVALAFGDGFIAARGATLLGDACGVAAAVLWGATTVLIRTTSLARATAAKTLFYQLAVSAAMLPLDYPTDRAALQAALPTVGLVAPVDARLLWIRNTLQLAEVECSQAYLAQARQRDDLHVLCEPRDLPFDAHGNLPAAGMSALGSGSQETAGGP